MRIRNAIVPHHPSNVPGKSIAFDQRPLRSADGFSLIELLVVIAIIALLASLLIPSLTNVRNKGKDLSDKADLSSLAIGLNLYATDHKGSYMFSSEYTPGQPGVTRWFIYMAKYTGGTYSSKNELFQSAYYPVDSPSPAGFTHYAMSPSVGRWWTVNDFRAGRPKNPVTSGEVSHPASVISFGDSFPVINSDGVMSSYLYFTIFSSSNNN